VFFAQIVDVETLQVLFWYPILQPDAG